MTELFYTFISAYLAIGFAKFMLCLCHMPVAIGVYSAMHYGVRGRVFLPAVLFIPFGAAAVCFVTWPMELYREGIRFFTLYSRFSLIRDCVRGFRNLHEVE